MCQRTDGLSKVATRWLLEIKHNREIIPSAQFVSKSVKDPFTPRRKAAEDENQFSANRVNDVANLLVVEKQVDELGDLDVVDGDDRLTKRSYPRGTKRSTSGTEASTQYESMGR